VRDAPGGDDAAIRRRSPIGPVGRRPVARRDGLHLGLDLGLDLDLQRMQLWMRLQQVEKGVVERVVVDESASGDTVTGHNGFSCGLQGRVSPSLARRIRR
jgi:hypothetical protein